MTIHRAEQILATIKTSLAQISGVEVLRGGADPQPESTPRRIVLRHGADDPVSPVGADNFSFIDSLLTVTIDLGVRASTHELAEQDLIALRRAVHIKITEDVQQGLSYVHDTRYGGASETETSGESDENFAVMTTPWVVYYRMNLTDPSV